MNIVELHGLVLLTR